MRAHSMLPDKPNLYVATLGQLVGSKIGKSVDEFAKLYARQHFAGHCHWLAKICVWATFIWDKVWHKTISQYKSRSAMSNEAFGRQLAKQLGIAYEKTSFENSWNAMCFISPEIRRSCDDISRQLTAARVKMLVVSYTNPLHLAYIQAYLPALLNRSFILATSQDYDGATSHQQIAEQALMNMQGKSHKKAISLTSTVNLYNLGIAEVLPTEQCHNSSDILSQLLISIPASSPTRVRSA
jgi:hypothetical protein